MLIGPARGESTAVDIVVTADMADRRASSQVYGSVALVGQMEDICRVLLQPYLESGEEAIGHSLDITHRSPVPIGATITVTATVAEVRPQRLRCEVLVRQSGRLVARGSFEQRIVKMGEFDAEVAAASV